MLSDGDLYADTAWGVLWAQRKKPRARCQERIRWEGGESSLQFNLSVRKLRQFFSFLHVLVLFNSYLCYLFRLYEQRVKPCRGVDRLQSFCASQVNIRWPQEKRLLVLGFGFLPLKCFLLRINKRGALTRLWTASCMRMKLQWFSCLGRFHNFFWTVHEILFHLQSQALYFFPLGFCCL